MTIDHFLFIGNVIILAILIYKEMQDRKQKKREVLYIDDMVIKMPPKKRYRIKVAIREVKKGEPRKISEEELKDESPFFRCDYYT